MLPKGQLVFVHNGRPLPADIRILAAAVQGDGAPPVGGAIQGGDLSALVWLDLQATGKTPSFDVVAYTGGPLRLKEYDAPVYVDLAGIRAAGESLPILRDHDLGREVGHTTELKIDSAVRLKGKVSGTGPDARRVLDNAANGFKWQASIGARVEELEVLASGARGQVNGRTVTGPCYIARKSLLRETSIVSVGADDGTSVSIAASAHLGKGSEMNFDAWIKAQGIDSASLTAIERSSLEAAFAKRTAPPATPPTPPPPAGSTPAGATPAELKIFGEQILDGFRREQADIAAIGEIAAAFPDIRAKAITEKWGRERVELEVLRRNRPTGTYIATGGSATVAHGDIMAAAVHQALKVPGHDKAFPDQVNQAAHSRFHGRIGLQELLIEAAAANGYAGHDRRLHDGNLKSILQHAMPDRDIRASGPSTFSLPGLLSNVANKFLLAGFMSVEDVYSRLGSKRTVTDFKTVTSYRMTGEDTFAEVGPDGELEHATIGEESYTNSAKTYGKIWVVTRQDSINDDLGALEAKPRKIGRGGRIKLNKVFWAKFQTPGNSANGNGFFSAGNANYQSGGGSALQASALLIALAAFRAMKDADNDPIDVEPRVLLVPPALEITAWELLKSEQVVSGSTTRVPSRNAWAGRFTLEMSKYLTSTTAWWLLCSPEDLPYIEICYLNGNESPIVEYVEADYDVLGFGYRGFFDFGVAMQDYRGANKSAGA